MSRQRRPPMKNAAPVGRLIEDLLSRRQMDGKLREYRVWTIWDEVVGAQIAARAQPVRIREGVLEVRVDQPVWMQQLQLLKPKLLLRLNQRLEGAQLKDIYLRRGRVTDNNAVNPSTKPRPADPPLGAEERERIEKTLQALRDPELRDHLRGLLTRQYRLEKGRRERGEPGT